MPDISASLDFLDATIFLYPSVQDAEQGTGFGGSGVIVGVPLLSHPHVLVRYAVTNWHVACSEGASVIRINRPTGRPHIVDADPSEWTFIPGKQDLAAIPLSLPADLSPPMIPTSHFIDGSTSEAHVGDDVFMVGRFIDFDGQETNKPATRFGFISMMDAPVRQRNGFSGSSHIVDMHSRTGFSGSPVYVYRPGSTTVLTEMKLTHGVQMPGPRASFRKWGIGNNVQLRLLGILWGFFPERWEIGAPKAGAKSSASLITEGSFVEGFSGMSCVAPAIQILELLAQPALKKVRDDLENGPMPLGLPL